MLVKSSFCNGTNLEVSVRLSMGIRIPFPDAGFVLIIKHNITKIKHTRFMFSPQDNSD